MTYDIGVFTRRRIISPAESYFAVPAVGGGGGGCAEATAFLSGAGSAIAGAYIGYYTSLICGLVTDGVWSQLDMLQIYATQDATVALLDLKGGTSATLSGSPTFTANLGFSFPTGSEIVNTQFNTSTGTNYQDNAASVGVWAVVCAASLSAFVIDSTSSPIIYPRYTADDKCYTRINDASFDGPVLADGTGFTLGVRSSSTARATYRNGGAGFTGTASGSARTNATLLVGANVPGAQAAAMCAGGDVTAVQNALYTRLRTYMTAVGVP